MERINIHSHGMSPVVRAEEVNEEVNEETLLEDEESEIITPILSFREHHDPGDISKDVEGSDEEMMDAEKKRRRKNQVVLPVPPQFRPLQKVAHSSFLRLPAELDNNNPSSVGIFRQFFPQSILRTIATNTNRYAMANGAGLSGRDWQQVEEDELIIWIAITIYCGLHKISPPDCWNQQSYMPAHEISRHMTLVRYQQIKRFLHISQPGRQVDMYFDKLEPLLSHIRTISKKLYTPSSNVSIDEMIIRFSGRSAHTVRMKNKPTPEGFKILSLCEAGYTYTFLPTSRIVPSQIPSIPGLNQTGCMVDHLVQQLPTHHLNFNVYMDNYFSNVRLFQHLRDKGIGACGTAKNQSGYPKELNVDKNTKMEWDTRSGITIGGVLAVFWQDNGPVKMLTTIHEMIGDEWEVTRSRRRPRETSTNAAKVRQVFGGSPRKDLKILKMVDDYNFNMGGVDIADQLRSYYATQQTTRRNWMPLFFWLLDTAIVNSYRIAGKAGSTRSHKEFRQHLVISLLESVHSTRGKRKAVENHHQSNPRPRVTKNYQLSNIRFTHGHHHPEWRENRAVCVWCAWMAQSTGAKKKNNNEAQLWCIECNVPLCINKFRSCFSEYHKNTQ